MNIALITDENYIVPTGTAIASVLNSNPSEEFTFYIVTRNLSEKAVKYLEDVLASESGRVNIEIISLSESDLIDFPIRSNDHVSVATYYRIYFQKLIPQNQEKILFLDGDILCVDSLRDFYDTDLTGYSCAVTHDERNDDPSNFTRLKYPQNNGYFCAGVMLINLDWWRKNNVMQKCLEYILAEPEACLWHDQDALNHVLSGTILWSDFRYNFTQGFYFDKSNMNINEKYYSDIDKSRKNPCIIHFSSAYKPWHVECNHPLKNQYRKFYKKYTGKKLHLVHRLKGKKRLIWEIKRFLEILHIRHFADFRKPIDFF